MCWFPLSEQASTCEKGPIGATRPCWGSRWGRACGRGADRYAQSLRRAAQPGASPRSTTPVTGIAFLYKAPSEPQGHLGNVITAKIGRVEKLSAEIEMDNACHFPCQADTTFIHSYKIVDLYIYMYMYMYIYI